MAAANPISVAASDLLANVPPPAGESASTPSDRYVQIIKSGAPGQPPIVVQAGQVQGGLDTGVIFSDHVEIKKGDQVVAGEQAIFDRKEQEVRFAGRVTYTDPDFSVFGEDADFDTDNRKVTFGEAGFEIPAQSARGSAQSITIGTDEKLTLTSVLFTTCPVDNVAWELKASSLLLDIDRGFGTARGVKLEFKGVPIFYSPYFTFPISDKRKSGFLTPSFAQRDSTGVDIAAPYYLNIKPNLDMTLTPHYLSRRGLQMESQLRYLLPDTHGEVDISYLPNDRVTGDSRHYFEFRHQTDFARRWSVAANIAQVSDDAYFEDLSSSVSVTSQLYLDRYVDLIYSAPFFRVRSRFQDFQTIDSTIAPEDRPYERMPQILFEGSWYAGPLAFDSRTELVDFEREVGTTGWRFDSTDELSLNFSRRGMYVTPAIALRQTNYSLNRVPPGTGTDDSLSRTLPITSVDAGVRLERRTRGGKPWLVTLEPRLLYVHVPYVDQSDLPVFDTISPDFNLVQLFRKYQFIGPDRIADTDQISVGVTARLVDEQTGEQKLAATLGQTRYLSTQKVNLPGFASGIGSTTGNASDYVAELAFRMAPSWDLSLGYQWNSDTKRTARTETRFEYRPDTKRLFGFAYRYRRGTLQQGDVSVVWPATDKWRIIGRYTYSFMEDQPLERLLGLEYDSCCWRLRVVGRSYVGSRSGETNNGISIQFQLKGLAQPADPPEALLDHGILTH